MNTIVPASAFTYNNTPIASLDEMLSLTDMWRASGSDPSKRPVEWLRSKPTQQFVLFLAEDLGLGEVGKSHFGLIKIKKGGADGGGTYAHWQLGMSYAKYLSPQFHAWCNTVVRERMEGKSVSVASLPPDVLELLRRTDGISRMLSHKVTTIEASLAALASFVQPNHPVYIRQGVTAGQIWRKHSLPKLKNGSTWLGNRLAEMGAKHEGKGELGVTTCRLFDPDKAEACMRNGLLHRTKVYATERMGQNALSLVR